MEKRYYVKLCYGWEITENGEVCHALEALNDQTLVPMDMGDRLRESLGVSENSEFDWGYLAVALPDAVVKQIKKDAVQEYLEQHQNDELHRDRKNAERMAYITPEKLRELRKRFPKGSWIRLVKMDGEENGPQPGDLGIVFNIDDTGTIFAAWASGGSLGVVYGEDICCLKDSPEITNQI